MSVAFSATNLINSPGQITLGAGPPATALVDAVDDAVEHMFDMRGMISSRLTGPAAPTFTVDLGSSASRDIIGWNCNIGIGSVTIQTQNAAGAAIQTFSSINPRFPFIAQGPSTPQAVKPTSAFQKIQFTFTPSTGDVDPVEVYFIYCANDVVTITDANRPLDRDIAAAAINQSGISQIRGEPLANFRTGSFTFNPIGLTDTTTILEAYANSNWGCEKLIMLEDYNDDAGNGNVVMQVIDITQPPRLNVLHQQGNSFEINFGGDNQTVNQSTDEFDTTLV